MSSCAREKNGTLLYRTYFRRHVSYALALKGSRSLCCWSILAQLQGDLSAGTAVAAANVIPWGFVSQEKVLESVTPDRAAGGGKTESRKVEKRAEYLNLDTWEFLRVRSCVCVVGAFVCVCVSFFTYHVWIVWSHLVYAPRQPMRYLFIGSIRYHMRYVYTSQSARQSVRGGLNGPLDKFCDLWSVILLTSMAQTHKSNPRLPSGGSKEGSAFF